VVELDVSRVAERAGVEPGFVSRVHELGLLALGDANSPADGAVHRVQVLDMLDRGGVSLDALATVVRTGSMGLDSIDAATRDAFSPLTNDTFAAMSQRSAIPLDLLLAIRDAVGGPAASPHDRLREDELEIVPLIEFQLAQGFRPIAIERAIRVYGDSLRRVAESEAEWWRSEIVQPMMAQGLTENDLGKRAAEITPELGAVSTNALLAIYRAQQRHAWTTNIVSGIAGALHRAGLQQRVDREPAMCFLDITGFTRLTQERGDLAAAELAERLSRVVQRTSVQHGGRPVKWLGDGVMFYFPDPGPGVLAALEMVDGVAAAGLPPAHVGLHAGPVLFQEGDFYGQTVNVASRIGEYARPGEVLVSQAVVDACTDTPVSFRPIGPVEFKGTADAIHLFAAAHAIT
jgi:adenylate cyclase